MRDRNNTGSSDGSENGNSCCDSSGHSSRGISITNFDGAYACTRVIVLASQHVHFCSFPDCTSHLPQSELSLLTQRYLMAVVLNKLGEGGFGTVLLVRKKDTGKLYALKGTCAFLLFRLRT